MDEKGCFLFLCYILCSFTEWLRLSSACTFLVTSPTTSLSPCIYLIHACLLYVFFSMPFNSFFYIHILFLCFRDICIKIINISLDFLGATQGRGNRSVYLTNFNVAAAVLFILYISTNICWVYVSLLLLSLAHEIYHFFFISLTKSYYFFKV